MFLRWVFVLSLPVVCLTSGWLSQPFLEPLSGTLLQIRQHVPYAVTLLAMVLAASFNQSRLFFALLTYGLFSAFLADDATRLLSVVPQTANTGTAQLVSVLMPLNLLILALSKERGVFTIRGWGFLGAILLQSGALVYLAQGPFPQWLSWIGKDYLSFPDLPLRTIPQLGWGMLSLALLVIGALLGLQRTGANAGLFGVIAGTTASLSCFPSASCIQTMLFAVGISTTILIFGTSHWLAYRDELTGLPARRALQEHLVKLGGRYTVAMVDVDHFKRFNDRYGHDIGDQVLRMVAHRLATAGGGGKAFRYGGEEFTLIYSGKTAEQAKPHLETVREAIAASDFTIRGKHRPRKKPKPLSKTRKSPRAQVKKVRVTVSVGVADSVRQRTSPDDVIKTADKALYRAKRGGRNRVSQ